MKKSELLKAHRLKFAVTPSIPSWIHPPSIAQGGYWIPSSNPVCIPIRNAISAIVVLSLPAVISRMSNNTESYVARVASSMLRRCLAASLSAWLTVLWSGLQWARIFPGWAIVFFVAYLVVRRVQPTNYRAYGLAALGIWFAFMAYSFWARNGFKRSPGEHR